VILTVVVIFQSAGSPGTPYGTFATAFGAGNPWKNVKVGGRLGVAGVILTLAAISLECG
jgi:hypothetical protein